MINDLVRDTVFEAIEQEKIQAVGMPSIESVDVTDAGLTYKALVEVYPTVTVAGFDGLTIERQTSSVTDADVETMIENLRKQRQTFADKDSAAADGDQVTFDFEGSIDGELFDGGASKDFKLVLGSNKMIPGFESGIVGISAGEEKVIDVTSLLTTKPKTWPVKPRNSRSPCLKLKPLYCRKSTHSSCNCSVSNWHLLMAASTS